MTLLTPKYQVKGTNERTNAHTVQFLEFYVIIDHWQSKIPMYKSIDILVTSVLTQIRFPHNFFITAWSVLLTSFGSGNRDRSFPSSFSRPTVILFHSSNSSARCITAKHSKIEQTFSCLLCCLPSTVLLLSGIMLLCVNFWCSTAYFAPALPSHHLCVFSGKAWRWLARARAPPWVTTPGSGSPWPKWPWRTSTVTSSPKTRSERWGNGHKFQMCTWKF